MTSCCVCQGADTTFVAQSQASQLTAAPLTDRADTSSSWGLNDVVQVDGRTGTVVFDLRPRWNYIKVKWSDTQSLSEVIRADRANSTKVSGHLSRSHPILTVSTLVPECLGTLVTRYMLPRSE